MGLTGKLRGVYHLARLSLHYGPAFPFTRVGRMKVFDVSFPFCSRPSLSYLAANAAGQCHEPAACQHMLKRFTGRTITFLDIGAFYGYYASLFGALNPENEIHAFEPNPLFYGTLERNFRMNCRKGGTYQLALSDEAGSIPFKDRSMKVSEEETSLRVPALTFTVWRKTHPVQPDLVKLDVHGSEGRVLFGMQDLLAEGGFDLYFELHPEHILAKYTLKEVISLVYDNGWEMAELPEFRMATAEDPSPLTPAQRQALEDPAQWTREDQAARRMFYCTHRSRA